MSKMSLTVAERINFPLMFSERSNMVSMTLQKAISEKVVFSKEDIEKYDLKFDEKLRQYTWDISKEDSVEIELSSKEVVYLQEQVKRIDTANEVTRFTFSICEKINALE